MIEVANYLKVLAHKLHQIKDNIQKPRHRSANALTVADIMRQTM
jgi:hypothetical protein